MHQSRITEDQENAIYAVEPRLWPAADDGQRLRLARGLEAGWYRIVLKLVSDLAEQAKQENRGNDNYPEIIELKQKWGGLRIYIRSGSPKMQALVDAAEEESESVCQECGEREDVSAYKDRGWIKSLCSGCQVLDALGKPELD